jgi:hypothetical protein
MGVGVNSYYLKLFPSPIVFISLPTVLDIDPPKVSVSPVAIMLLTIDLLTIDLLTAAPLYQAELDKNGYKHVLKFEPPTHPEKKRNRNKKII